MVKPAGIIVLFLFLFSSSRAQIVPQDTIFLMNGHVVAEKVVDTLLGAITIFNPDKHGKKIHYEWDQLYMVKYASGEKRYYYQQDSTINHWFSREEMWFYMLGEKDARKGFKAHGSLIGAGIAGFVGGMTGTLWGPVAPYGFMALSGLPKVRIRAESVSHPALVESDAYLLGYERVARQKRKIRSVIGGTIGLALGYGFYALFHNFYPETLDVGFNK